MPRLRQVPKAEAAPVVDKMYDLVFGDRDPVAEPGTHGGTTGDFWTVFANSPDIFENVVGMFKVYRSRRRSIDPVHRELAQTRVGWLTQSKFVFSQHCKSLRELGVSEERIQAVKVGAASTMFDQQERVVLAYTDCLISGYGRVPDDLFDELKSFMNDVQILELTFISCVYMLNGVMVRALKLEFDDREEAVLEVPGQQGFFDEKHDWANNSTSPTVKKQPIQPT
jgi:alkylhydroperoxidase family enzyme